MDESHEKVALIFDNRNYDDPLLEHRKESHIDFGKKLTYLLSLCNKMERFLINYFFLDKAFYTALCSVRSTIIIPRENEGI